MALRGCIRIHGFPLQILLNENPSWRGSPVAVTKEEKPQSPILAVSRAAREKGLAPGMKYASALALVPGLRARVVSRERVAAARDLIVKTVLSYTPDVELCPFDEDAVWVSLEGLWSLFDSEAKWIEQVRDALAAQGFRALVVAGFTRFGTYAVSRCRPRSTVFARREEELAELGRASIGVLPLPVRVRRTLARLEIRSVRQFVALPPGETARRFGREAGLLRDAILSDDPLPIQPVAIRETVPVRRRLDAPLTDLELLMPCIEELLENETARAEADRSVVSAITLVLRMEDGQRSTDVIRPAAPTLRTAVLQRLVRLRLSGRQLTSGVEDVEIHSTRTRPSRAQEELFATRGRDLRAGSRAFAAIRARFGNESVSRARMADSHLPERSFTWVEMREPVLPAGPSGQAGPRPERVVRRLLFEPRPVPPDSDGPPILAGPFVVSGSWWEGTPCHREYAYRQCRDGLQWQFVDRLTGRTWLQGVVD